MRYLDSRVGIVLALLLGLPASIGCERQKAKEREEKGRVNVEVQTPAGGTSVDVQYPRHEDHKNKDRADPD